MMQSKPNLFIAGAPKSGTTALSRYLSEHPNIFMSEQGGEKEPKYFAPDFPESPPPVKTLKDYMALFSSAPRSARYLGEASVTYLYSRVAADRILDFNSEAVFVVAVRNPVDIAQAWHNERLKISGETVVDFERAWRLQEKRRHGHALPSPDSEPGAFQYGQIASIGSQLRRFLSVVSNERVHLIVYDDFVQDPASVYRALLAFLDLPDDGRSEFPIVNPRVRYRYPALQQRLYVVSRLRQSLGIPGGIGIHKWLEARNLTTGVPRISNRFRAELGEYFRKEVEILEGILNRDLSSWIR